MIIDYKALETPFPGQGTSQSQVHSGKVLTGIASKGLPYAATRREHRMRFAMLQYLVQPAIWRALVQYSEQGNPSLRDLGGAIW